MNFEGSGLNPAWASVDPAGPEATALISKLSPGPLTINVAGR